MTEVRPLDNISRRVPIAQRVVTAGSFWARFRGLMGRTELAPEEGLWLPSDTSIHMFFMRFPIDCLFVSVPRADGTREVVATYEALPPWRGIVMPVRGAAGVVELAAGTIARTGTRTGDLVRFG